MRQAPTTDGILVERDGDIVLGRPRAHFTLAYDGIGLSPDGGTTWLLPRLIGLRRAPARSTARRRLLDSRVTPFETYPAAEARGIAAMGRTAEGKEGIAAFLEKRKPGFAKRDPRGEH